MPRLDPERLSIMLLPGGIDDRQDGRHARVIGRKLREMFPDFWFAGAKEGIAPPTIQGAKAAFDTYVTSNLPDYKGLLVVNLAEEAYANGRWGHGIGEVTLRVLEACGRMQKPAGLFYDPTPSFNRNEFPADVKDRVVRLQKLRDAGVVHLMRKQLNAVPGIALANTGR